MANSEQQVGNKIIKALLQSKFKDIDVDVLMEIISVTPDVEVATEMLCGIYEAPEVPVEPSNNMLETYNDRTNIKFISFDKWCNEVNYSYQDIKVIKVWLDVEEYKEKPLPTYDEIKANESEFLIGYWLDDICRKQGLNYDDVKDKYKKHIIKGDVKEGIKESSVALTTWLC